MSSSVAALLAEHDALQPLRKAWQPNGGPKYSAAVKALFDLPAIELLCAFYESAPPDERARLRTRASEGNLRDQLDLYLIDAHRRLRATGDPRWLRQGLLAASLADFGRDARDTLLALQALVADAPDPAADLRSVAALSSTTQTGIGSPRELLESLVWRQPGRPQ